MRLSILLFLASFFCLSACAAPQNEVSRVSSPDGIVDAVLIQTGGNATASDAYTVYMTAHGKPIGDEKAVFKADHLEGLNIQWRGPKFLEISYSLGRIFFFSNFWQSNNVGDYSYVVEVRLNPLTSSFSLSEKDRWEEK